MVELHANDLLDQRIIENGKFTRNITSGSLINAIKEMIDLMNTTLNFRNLKIELQIDYMNIPRFAKFDKRRLQQVLLNLISNAVKYSTKGIIIVIPQVLMFSNNVQQLCVSVKDSGVGLKPDQLERIFTPFTNNANSNARSSHISNGIGLSVCK